MTESEKIEDDRHLRKILDFYRKSGFRIALDDLGSGYGSLNRLAALRPDFVKLDMSLVQDVDQDPYLAAIASKLLELAEDLGVSVVAEGVETEEQWGASSSPTARTSRRATYSPNPLSRRPSPLTRS